MDQFYQILRKVQKQERTNGSLSRVDENFYDQIHEYLDDLRKQAITDPFSNAFATLNEAQRIATEICERREHKITNSAVSNIQRSYHLFTGKPKFDLVDTTPLNLTPEEETFYYSLIDTLKNHRNTISLEKLSDDVNKKDTKIKSVIKSRETQTNTLDNDSGKNDDEVLDRIDEISNAKTIVDEKRESIEKQVIKSKIESSKPKSQSIEDNPNAFDETEEFIDLESKKLAKDTELVTMLVFDDENAIMGVDEKVYGPFRPQDIVILPAVNAKIFIKNHKGRQVKI